MVASTEAFAHPECAATGQTGPALHLTVHGDFMNHADLLIVDDDDATRTGLRELLVNAGFTVDVARDGAEAMEKINSHDFCVVLLDVRLPKSAGWISWLAVTANGGLRRSSS